MAPFGVHSNLGRNRANIPYLVSVQSRRYDAAVTRIVIPLMRLPGLRDTDPWLAPKFVTQDERFERNPLLMFAAPVPVLGPVVASLAADADASRVIAAIDAVIAQAFG